MVLHLPLLTMQKKQDEMRKLAEGKNLRLCGKYGDDRTPAGDVYVLRTGVTMGKTEQQVLDTLLETAKTIVAR